MFDDAHALRIVYGGSETLQREYKRSMPWTGQGRFKLIKTIAALANCGGGYLIVGYDEEKQGDERFVGVNDADLESWDVTNVARDANNHIRPDIDIEVLRPQSKKSGKTFVVVRVPSHGAEPHICAKGTGNATGTKLRSGALYYRNRNKEVTEIGRLDDWRDLVKRLTLAKKHEIKELIESALTAIGPKNPQLAVSGIDLDIETLPIEERALDLRTSETTDLPLLIFAAVPVSDSLAQDTENSKIALKSASVDYRGWPFIFYLEQGECCHPQFDEDAIWAVDTEPFNERPTFYYWQFKYLSSLFYSAQITPESSVGLGSEIFAYDHAKLLAEALIAVGRLYESLGYSVDTPIDILLKYTNLSEASITLTRHSLLPHPYKGSQLVLQNTIHLNELLTLPWKWAADILAEIGQRMGARQSLPVDIMGGLAKKHLSHGQKLY